MRRRCTKEEGLPGVVNAMADGLQPPALQLVATVCAICGRGADSRQLYPANFRLADLNSEVFSARRLPDRIHYRMVRCTQCGLVRSDPVADGETLAELYTHSTFDYQDEVSSLKRTYGGYLDQLERYGANRGSLLEIGCGNGFLLEEALARGYQGVRGIEPSLAAASSARPEIKPLIIRGMMTPGVFEPGTFDVVCLFQVFDHLPDPGAVLDECARVLKPGGLILCMNHNVSAVSSRLLGSRSPIIDIEHTYLYNPATISRIFEARGLTVLHVSSARNIYSVTYLAHLLPLTTSIKAAVLATLRRLRLGRLEMSVPLGNLYLVARRPLEPPHLGG